MASGLVKLNKIKRMESKKSHSWWWDSHISPKNKWLQENIHKMDELLKRMLKLVEEDADSFAKKAELYFKRRPELVNLVEEFYRMYRALAERYDLVSGELRKTTPSDLGSQGSSATSDVTSEPSLSIQSPDQRGSHRKSGSRAAGFDVFLGSGSDLNSKGGDSASSLDSESELESDDSSVNNSAQGSGEEKRLQKRIVELEAELEEVKEKFQVQGGEICEGCKKTFNESAEVHAKIAATEEELRIAKEKIQASKEEITRLSTKLQRCKDFDLSAVAEPNQVHNLQQNANDLAGEVSGSAEIILGIEEDLRAKTERLCESVEEVASLRQDVISLESQLESTQKEVCLCKSELDSSNGEVSKLQDWMVRYQTKLADRDQEIQALREALSDENMQLRTEINRMTEERTHLEHNLKQLVLRHQHAEEEARRVGVAKAEMQVISQEQTTQLKEEINERDGCIEELKQQLNELRLKYHALTAVKDDLNRKIAALGADISNKNKQIEGAEVEQKMVANLQIRVKELEIEVERKQETLDGRAEGKEEAVRQLCLSLEHYCSGYHQLQQAVTTQERPVITHKLCFSLEHYRSGYHQLRQAAIAHKKLTVKAT